MEYQEAPKLYVSDPKPGDKGNVVEDTVCGACGNTIGAGEASVVGEVQVHCGPDRLPRKVGLCVLCATCTPGFASKPKPEFR